MRTPYKVITRLVARSEEGPIATESNVLATEGVHEAALALDRASTLDFVRFMNSEDRRVPEVVAGCLEQIAWAADEIAERLRRGGHWHAFGAGTSGRLAVLDAAECPSTFGVAPDLVVGHLAGGANAFENADEAAEDDDRGGEQDVVAAGITAADAVLGVSASGGTPYVLGVLAAAGRRGALTVALTCAPGSAAARLAGIAIEVATGPEVVAGSTRLKAGTAQKLILNMLSTAVFRSLGRVYRGRMVEVRAENDKLRRRLERTVRELTGAGAREAAAALAESGGSGRLAVAMLRLGVSRAEAERRLEAAGGRLQDLLWS